MVDQTDNSTGVTGLTLTIRASKDGAAFAAITPTVTELESGWYNLALTTTHTNTLGFILIDVTGTGAYLEPQKYQVVPDLPGTISATGIQSIWDALTSALTTSGSIGKRISDFLTGDAFTRLGAPVGASISADIAQVESNVVAIKAKTDNLPSDPADASDIAASFGTVNTKLDTIDDFVDTEVAAILAAVVTEVADIKAKTDNLPSDPADASDIASAFGTVNSSLAAIVGYVDTEVAAIKAKTDNLPANTTARLDDIDTAIAAKPGYMLKKNTAASGFQFTMYSSTDGTPLAGIMDLDIELSQDGSSFTNATNSPVELNSGWYKIDLTASEMNGKKIGFRCTGTGARRTDFELLTQD